MARPSDPDKAAERLRSRLSHVPAATVEAMVAARRRGPLAKRGAAAATEDFFAGLAAAGRAPEQAAASDFERVATSRTRLYTLLWALETFAPDLPLAAARPIRQRWDKWLNKRYNEKPRRPRASTQVGIRAEAWPEAWRAALPALARRIRLPGGHVLKPLAPKTRGSVEQAVGMLAAARLWAEARGVSLGEALSPDLIDAFVRYMLVERGASARTAADYIERVAMFAARGQLLDEPTSREISDAISRLREEADEQTPAKRKTVRGFAAVFDLGDVLLRAAAIHGDAKRAAGHTAAAARLRCKAMTLGVLVNCGDRQGDLMNWRIGREILRGEDGLWRPAFRQLKTGGMKDNGPLWPYVSSLIDSHILGDRPDWVLKRRLDELDGRNLLTLEEAPFGGYMPSRFLHEEFGISGHLVRSLIVDALSRHQPDAAWAAQKLLGHANRRMQATYQTDFQHVAALKAYHATLAEAAGSSAGKGGL